MALGLGQMMGFKFVENFNFPYVSRSISDFWRRWHISLSNWFRDIVFYPLERRRLKFLGQPFNIMIVFLLTGLWHGLTINFVIWGGVHGLALVFESTPLGRRFRNTWMPIQHIYALLIILAGWVFFRSPTPHFAFVFFRRLMGDARGLEPLPFDVTSPLPFIEPTYLLALFAAVLLSLPVRDWFKKLMPGISAIKLSAGVYGQVASDLIMMIFLLASIAVMADSGFVPAIYGNF
jgi:alginate O-acetyltransferase complex protein AlgI